MLLQLVPVHGVVPALPQHQADLVDDGVAVTQQLYIKLAVWKRFSVDENLRHFWWKAAWNESYWSHLKTGPNHYQQVTKLLVPGNGVMEMVRKTLPKEDNVRLHDRDGGERTGLSLG